MKALIWIVTYIVGFVIYSVLFIFMQNLTGAILLFFVMFALLTFVARSICIKLDSTKSRKLEKASIDQGIAPIEYIRNQVPRIVFDTCETHRGNKMELDKYLKHCIVINLITKRHYGILMKEYSNITFEEEE